MKNRDQVTPAQVTALKSMGRLAGVSTPAQLIQLFLKTIARRYSSLFIDLNRTMKQSGL